MKPLPDNSFEMVVRLRLTKMNDRTLPFFYIVAINQKTRRDGRPFEFLGRYHFSPDRENCLRVFLKEERTKYWIAVGAQPSDTVLRLLGKVIDF